MAAKSRRWYQFSILAALIVTTVVALAVAVFVQPARQQRAAVAQILAVHGQVFYEHERGGPYVEGSEPSPPGPAWLRHLIGADFFQTVIGVGIFNATSRPEDVATALDAATRLPKLEALDVACEVFGDEHVRQVAKLHTLQRINIQQSISGAEIAHLALLKNLTSLCIAGDFSAEDLLPIVNLNRLEGLSIHGRISSDEITSIARLTSLTTLGLGGPVADSDMPKLASLTQLVVLYCNTGTVHYLLTQTSNCDFDEVSLPDAIDYLTSKHGCSGRVDLAAISAGGIDLERVAITATKSGIPLGQLLTELLEPEGLAYRIEDNVLVITTREEVERTHAGINELKRRLPNLRNVEVGW